MRPFGIEVVYKTSNETWQPGNHKQPHYDTNCFNNFVVLFSSSNNVLILLTAARRVYAIVMH